jgi:hypothetical protein
MEVKYYLEMDQVEICELKSSIEPGLFCCKTIYIEFLFLGLLLILFGASIIGMITVYSIYL